MRRAVAAAIGLLVVLAGCQRPPDVDQNGPPERTFAIGRLGSVVPKSTATEPKVYSSWTTTPVVTISTEITGADRTNYESLLRTTLEVVQSPEFRDNAEDLQEKYFEVYLNDASNQHSIGHAAHLYRAPPPVMGYPPVRIQHWNGLPTTGNDPDVKGGYRIRMSPQGPLRRWQLSVVQRSCAINTVAHELAHTLLAEPRGAMVFTDGDSEAAPSRLNGTTGSYVLGQLAQCTYLQRQGRITKAQVAQCMPVFYVVEGTGASRRGVFAKDQCGLFEDPKKAVKL